MWLFFQAQVVLQRRKSTAIDVSSLPSVWENVYTLAQYLQLPRTDHSLGSSRAREQVDYTLLLLSACERFSGVCGGGVLSCENGVR
jgi:hypothetical protein